MSSFGLFGLLGYWADSMDMLIVTFLAVGICLAIGIPIGIWMGRSKRATSAITPILDLLQTLPSFVYLLPITLFFSIGVAAAVIVTLIYALPPVIRISAHGIRTVSGETIEAMESLGTSRAQMLRKVQLPMAKRTIIVGVNQTIMAALSMATIAAFVDGPGLGKPVDQGAGVARRRPCLHRRSVHRHHGDHAGPRHDGSQRPQRGRSCLAAARRRCAGSRSPSEVPRPWCASSCRAQYLKASPRFPEDPVDLGTPFGKAAPTRWPPGSPTTRPPSRTAIKDDVTLT